MELYIGVLFDKSDKPATIQSDKINGFYSSSKEGFTYLIDIVKKSPNIKVINDDNKNLQMEFELTNSEMKVIVGALYGDDITQKLFRKPFPVSDLLLLKYDDIWLSQLMTIDERAILLKYKNNFSKTFIDLLDRDHNLRTMFNDLIKYECNEAELNKIVNYLIDKYSSDFSENLLPAGKDKIIYLADVVQVICSADA